MTVLYFDCFSGAAGDMILGALLDAGAPEEEVRKALDALDLPGWELHLSDTTRASVRALRAEVTIEHPEPARSYRVVDEIVAGAPLPPGVRRRALRTLRVLAAAEALVHGVGLDEVHLHETGATDALVDIVGSCAAIESFAPTTIAASAVATGTGTVEASHGTLPVPPPAVTEMLVGVPVYGRGPHELVTPTGAALLVANCEMFGELPPMRITTSGYGAGSRDTQERPNVVRVLVGDEIDGGAQTAVLLEANIDDMSPELLPHAVERLLAAGAQDAWLTPIVMKKGRPAYTLSVLAPPLDAEALEKIIFAETTTLGVRRRAVAKTALERRVEAVDVAGAPVRIKLGISGGRVITAAPEYEDVVALADRLGIPLPDAYAAASAAGEKFTSGEGAS